MKLTRHDDTTRLLDDSDAVVETIEITKDLQTARSLLRTTNALETTDGTPIHETVTISRKSVWSFSQQALFFKNYRPYARYRPVIHALVERDVDHIELDPELDDLARFLDPYDIAVTIRDDRDQSGIDDGGATATAEPLTRLREWLALSGTVALAAAVTLVAAVSLLCSGRRSLVYSSDRVSAPAYDCDFRMRGVYEALDRTGHLYREAFHTIFADGTFFDNLRQRRRPALYLNTLAPVTERFVSTEPPTFDLSAFDTADRPFVQHILRLTDRESRRRRVETRLLAALLQHASIDALYAMDDPRYVNRLVLACKLADIPTYGFQHGHYNKYQAGWLNEGLPRESSVTFDRLSVWNDYWRSVLLEHSNCYHGGNVAIGGVQREFNADPVTESPGPFADLSDVSVLLPYETSAEKETVMTYVETLAECGAEIVFKPRPDRPVEEQFTEYGLDTDEVAVVDEVTAETLPKFDCVAGTYSTFLYEMLYYGKPLLLLATDYDFGHQLFDDELGLVIETVTPDEILAYLDEFDPVEVRERVWPNADTEFTDTVVKLLTERSR